MAVLELRNQWTVLVLGFVSLLIYFEPFYPFDINIKSYVGNLSAGLFGSFITIFLVDVAIEQKREKERIAKIDVALKQLRNPLINHLNLLSDWYKAAAPNQPASWPITIPDIFNDDYYLQIRFLDFYAKAPVFPSTRWYNHNARKASIFKSNLEKINAKYADYFDSDFMKLLESIENSSLIDSLISWGDLPHAMEEACKEHGQTNMSICTVDCTLNNDDTIKMVRDHIILLIKLLDKYDKDNPITIGDLILWPKGVQPTWGSSRFKA